MKKINYLNQKLKKLQSQKVNFDSLENISILQFIKYKNIISKKARINEQMKKAKASLNEINTWYDNLNKSLIENPKINCRKYDKLQKKAEFKKNFKLYKLGFIEKIPLPPLLQKVKNSISQNSFVQNVRKQYHFFKSHLLPQKINNFAVNTAKLGIKGYRKIQADCRFIRDTVASKNSFSYLKNVIQEANAQLDYAEMHQKTHSRAFTDEEQKFRDSLKFDSSKKSSTTDVIPDLKKDLRNITYSTLQKKATGKHFVEYHL